MTHPKTPAQLAEARQLTSTLNTLKTGEAPGSQPEPAAISGTGKLGRELLRAAWDGNLAEVKRLLSEDADVQYRDSDGFRAIDRARNNGHRAIVTLLRAAEKKKTN